MTVLSIIIALLVLCALIFFHELGHFIAGKRAGITVVEFAIGFGPRIVKWNKNGTEYSIRAFPLGGACMFLGEDEDSDEAGAFNKASIPGRLTTLLSGPLFNILLGFLLAGALMFFYGNRISVVSETTVGSSAQEAGIQQGDIITEVNGKNVYFAGQAAQYLGEADDTDIHVTVDRDGEYHEFTLEKREEDGEMKVGIWSETVREDLGFFESIWVGIRWSFYVLYEMIRGLGMLVASLFGGAAVEGGVVGPVGTISLIGEAARSGLESLLVLATILSMNLGIVNLLPIPALDGGRLIFILIEAVRGKPINPDKEGLVHLIGFAALMLLIVVLTISDVTRLIRGG